MTEDELIKLLNDKLSIDACKLEPLEGLSNRVYKVVATDGKKYVFKVLSHNPKEIFRLFEDHAIKLSQTSDLILYNDKRYRLERYIDHENISKQEFMKEPMCIFQLYCIARFNSCNSIVSDKPNLLYIVENSKAELMDILAKRIAGIKDAKLREEITSKVEVVNRVYEHYRARAKEEKLVLSHGDCYYRNYLYSTDDRQLYLIDYEYAGYNPLGMDVLVLYQEYMTDYDADHPPGPKALYENLPDDDTFRRLLRFYLYFYKYNAELKGLKHDDAFVKKVEADQRFNDISKDEVEAILQRFGYYGVLTQIFFFYWALYLLELDGVDFDYIRFCQLKYELLGYFLGKNGMSIAAFEDGAFN